MENVRNNAEIIYGKLFDDEPVPISGIRKAGQVTVSGKVVRLDKRETKHGKLMVIFDINDQTDTISVKLFPRTEQKERLLAYLKEGASVVVKATADIDSFDGELSLGYVQGIKKGKESEEAVIMDNAPEKRVELHCHTRMSDMDGVSSVEDLMERAAEWGHKALAITDHGVVQSFTDAFHALPAIRKKHPEFKVIYGLEGYLVDDSTGIVVNERGQSFDGKFIVFDIETTGFSPQKNKIIEIGAVKIINGEIIGSFHSFINPGEPIPSMITKLTSITDEMVANAPAINIILPEFLEYCEGAVLVAHNARFDMGFITQKARDMGIETNFTYIDTVAMARALLPNLGRFKLENVAKALNVSLENHHRATDDAKCTANIFLKLSEMLKEREMNDLSSLYEFGRSSTDIIKKARTYHVTILAKNETGRINLYKLVSLSHIDYFYRTPRIPKSLLEKYREGLIIGSACEAGELYQFIVDDRSREDILNIASFYDYFEVQPLKNNEFMIRDEHYENVCSRDDLININKKIIALGEQLNKPVVATGDVHFLNPEDEIYRQILMAGKGFADADNESSMFLKTTEEMLEEFSYLPYDKAYEIVVTNTNLIADMINDIAPVRPDKCPPVIENSDEMLRSMCYERASELYGDKLPDIVKERLDMELDSIIGNGYSALYIIGQKLVDRSLQEGYLVGSRGSVGSSFAAFASGITEVNPLPPHYLCPKCKYSDFVSEDVIRFKGNSGWDMPDKRCPVCGAPLKKDGFDIPFEVFMGFEGDKEPDIDLNFSGKIQGLIHKYTEEIFGEGNCFKAGTIGTIAEKSAYGFVKSYFEERGITKRRAEIERLATGCMGVKRGTGQHPGGIIVLPKGEDINSFTPIQHPANDMDSDILTTHFDYHSIDHNLLKLDLLGHDDPTMLRFLKDCTGFDPKDVPFDDAKVLSLFKSTDALGIKPSQIGGTRVGCLGLPEFGTDFAMSMVVDARPKSLSDLIRLSGLSHGTDVWLGNAKDLIDSGVATLSSCICCRDDIMTYLISKGIDPEEAFKTMENVRKGKVASGKCEKWDAWMEDMLKHGVPEWYIRSCEKIKYMFPKAHAAAYVMMAWRIAYYKIYYPHAFYAAWFTIRAKTLNYEKMFQGLDIVNGYLKMYRSKTYFTPAEKDEYTALRIVEEMYARGIEIEQINLENLSKVNAGSFSVDGKKIIPSLISIGRLGEKAAELIIEAAKGDSFTSVEDFRDRTKCPKTVVDNMLHLGILEGLPASDQLSLFDFME